MSRIENVSARAWFRTPLMAGFECTSYVRRDGVRLDVLAQTQHDELAEQDYSLVACHGMSCVRDGVMWHRIEAAPGQYDWSSFERMVEAAERAGVRVMWDLLHFGWPSWTSPAQDGFVASFTRFAAGVAKRSGVDAAFVPINEISFLAWACAEEGFMHPFLRGHSAQVKHTLCAAFISAVAAIRCHNPNAAIACAEPLIAVHPCTPNDDEAANRANAAQYEALDMLLGRQSPELNGSETLVDIIGLNHYPHSQWKIPSREPPSITCELSTLLGDVAARYQKPLFIAETGAEADLRASWLQYVGSQVDIARARGIDVLSICLYPVLNHLGWEDNRYCPNGLFCGMAKHRPIYGPLAQIVADLLVSNKQRDLAGAMPELAA